MTVIKFIKTIVDQALYEEQYVRDCELFAWFSYKNLSNLYYDLLPSYFIRYMSYKKCDLVLLHKKQMYIPDDIMSSNDFGALYFQYFIDINNEELNSIRKILNYQKKLKIYVVQFLQLNHYEIDARTVSVYFNPFENNLEIVIAVNNKGFQVVNTWDIKFQNFIQNLRNNVTMHNYRSLELKQKLELKKKNQKSDHKPPKH